MEGADTPRDFNMPGSKPARDGRPVDRILMATALFSKMAEAIDRRDYGIASDCRDKLAQLGYVVHDKRAIPPDRRKILVLDPRRAGGGTNETEPKSAPMWAGRGHGPR